MEALPLTVIFLYYHTNNEINKFNMSRNVLFNDCSFSIVIHINFVFKLFYSVMGQAVWGFLNPPSGLTALCKPLFSNDVFLFAFQSLFCVFLE